MMFNIYFLNILGRKIWLEIEKTGVTKLIIIESR